MGVAAGLLLFAGAQVTAPGESPSQLTEAARQNAFEEIKALASIKAQLRPAQVKLDSQFIFASLQQTNGIIHPAAPKLRHGLKPESDGRIKVEIVGKVTPELLAAIQGASGTVLGSWPSARSTLALLPLGEIERLAEREEVTFIRPAPESRRNYVDSEGDTTHAAIQARANSGVNGAGIKVGVLSNSINTTNNPLAAAIAGGNIDGTNTFIIAGQGGSGDAEGLAMCEIIHDLAPGASIYFATASAGEAQMASNIVTLAQVGCRIICDDETYENESPFQDQVIAQAVNTVSDMGVVYLSCAANSGNRDSAMSSTWEGNFYPGRAIAGYGLALDFSKGTQTNAVSEDAILAEGQDFRADLFWSDPLGASTNDYDLFMVNGLGNIVYASQNRQNGTQDPYESLPDPAGLSHGYYLVVTLYSGTTNRYLHLGFGRGVLAYATAACTRGHNACDAPNMITVAATPADTAYSAGNPTGPYPNPFNSANKVEFFSADGPRVMFYNADGSAITPGNFTATGGRVLLKPDLTAADGVTTTQQPTFAPFFGTSCATPHAAAIAALVWSYNPTLTATEVHGILTNSCIDIMEPGWDRNSGWGILMATTALQNTPAAPPPPPPAPQFVSGSSSYLSGGGFQVALKGSVNSNYDILISSDLVTWSRLTTIKMTNTVSIFSDTSANPGPRFYQARFTP